MGEESKTHTGALATLARQGALLRRNLRTPISIESRRVALERKITLDFPHFQGFLTQYSANISMTGLFVQAERPEPPGTIVAFEFRLADGLNLIRGEAEVVWRRREMEALDRPPGMGLRFVRLDKESRRLIRWAVEKRLREGGKPFEVDEHPVENEGMTHGVEDLDLVHPGTEDEVDPRLHAYAGAAVAKSWFERWRLAILAAAVTMLAGALFLLYQQLRHRSSTESRSPATATKAAKPETPAVVEAARPEAPEKAEQGVAAGLDMVAAWASAWSQQRVDDYLSFYSDDFRPPRGMGLAEWGELRRSRFLKPRRIEVGITELDAVLESPRRCRVSFLQFYASDSYRDTTRKILVLTLEDGRWQILEERAGQ